MQKTGCADQPLPYHPPSKAELTPPKTTLLRSALITHKEIKLLQEKAMAEKDQKSASNQKHPAGIEGVIVPLHNGKGDLLPGVLQMAIAEFLDDQKIKVSESYKTTGSFNIANHLALSPDGQMLITLGETADRHFFKVWHVVDDKVQEPHEQQIFTRKPYDGSPYDGPPLAIRWSPDSKKFIYLGNTLLRDPKYGRLAIFWNLFIRNRNTVEQAWQDETQWESHQKEDLHPNVAWHPTSNVVAVGWPRTGKPVVRLHFFDDNNKPDDYESKDGRSAVWNPDGKTLVTGDMREHHESFSTVTVWVAGNISENFRAKQQECRFILGDINELAFNKEGTALAILHHHGEKKLLTINTIDKNGSINQKSSKLFELPGSGLATRFL